MTLGANTVTSGHGAAMGGGGREVAVEEWTRLESQEPMQHKSPFPGAQWHPSNGVPLFAWPLLVFAVLAVSSAASAFKQMMDVPAITLAAWRLQLTGVLLSIGAVWQWFRELGPEERARCFASWHLMLGSGICLGLHFGLWVWGLEHTSLTHSLFFVSLTPVVLTAGMLILRKPVSKGEIFGSLLAFLGGCFLALDPWKSSEEAKEVSVQGDVASLLAAVAFIGYLLIGRQLRSWMPIFVYAAPVTCIGALGLTLVALVADGASFVKPGAEGVFGWLASAHYAPLVVYLSIGPGIVGHTGFNTLLRYLTPLTIALAFQLEPLVGTLIGFALGVVDAPGLATWIGGLVVLLATCWVTSSTVKREATEMQRGLAVLELGHVMDRPDLDPDSLSVMAGGGKHNDPAYETDETELIMRDVRGDEIGEEGDDSMPLIRHTHPHAPDR
mmetsp:Transcript_15190/g.26341  ORF Transcript_15190/g.26341 Transcript_15190/m.26341 type:complete len:442 (+) Transcript_15190:67-1392(+)